MKNTITPPLNRSDTVAFQMIADHVGHDIECVTYGDDERGTVNVAIECLDCGTVIADEDRHPEEA